MAEPAIVPLRNDRTRPLKSTIGDDSEAPPLPFLLSDRSPECYSRWNDGRLDPGEYSRIGHNVGGISHSGGVRRGVALI